MIHKHILTAPQCCRFYQPRPLPPPSDTSARPTAKAGNTILFEDVSISTFTSKTLVKWLKNSIKANQF